MNPFISVFTDSVDWNDPFGETDTRVSVPTVTISVEEYEHLLLRVATAERMYADAKQYVSWLEITKSNLIDDWQKALSTIDELARRAK